MPAKPVKSDFSEKKKKLKLEKACYSVIYRGKKFLFLKPVHVKNWNAPGGRMEKGETEEYTARREVFEETGLKNLVFVPNFRHVNKYTMYRDGEQVERHVIFFLAESKSGDITLSHEHTAYEWLSFEDSIQRVRFPGLKSIFTAAAKKLEPGFQVTTKQSPNSSPKLEH